MAKIFQIEFDSTTEEIGKAYKIFQNKYALKKKILYSVVYAIVLILGIDLIIKNYTSPTGYIASGLALGILIFNWIKPELIRKKLMKNLSELDNNEKYIMSFYDEKLVVETIIDKSVPTETVAITSTGVYTVEEGSEAEKEMSENAAEDEVFAPTTYLLSETDLCFFEKDDLLMIFINRSYIQTIPVRCLSVEQLEQVRAYYTDKNLY